MGKPDITFRRRRKLSAEQRQVIADRLQLAGVEADLDYHAAAFALCVSVRTVEKAVAERDIGFYRDGARITFGRRHIEEYRRRREQRARQRGRKDASTR